MKGSHGMGTALRPQEIIDHQGDIHIIFINIDSMEKNLTPSYHHFALLFTFPETWDPFQHKTLRPWLPLLYKPMNKKLRAKLRRSGKGMVVKKMRDDGSISVYGSQNTN